MLENKRENRKYKIGKEGGVRKEKTGNIFVEYYGDIIFIIFLVLYFAYPLQFNVNHINPAIPKPRPLLAPWLV